MINAPQVAKRAKEQLVEITRLHPDTVSSIRKEEDGWHVSVEVVEMKRIPDSTDMLATYELLLDAEGNLLNYQRTRRYYRSQADAG
jgi:hypothetical protein